MGIGDFVNKDLIDKAVDAVHEHQDKVDAAIDKATDAVQDRTSDNVDGFVEKASQKAKDFT